MEEKYRELTDLKMRPRVEPHKLFRYYGGKYYLIPDIVKEIGESYARFDIKCIVDVFGGSGTVILSLPQEWKVNRVYNDIDKRLYTTLKVLQDPIKRQQVIDFLTFSLRSRQEFDEFKDSNWDELNDIEIAKRYIYLIANSFNGAMKSFRININSDKGSSIMQTINSINRNIRYLQEHLIIENLDFREIIKRYCGEHTFFYLDPPYLNGGKTYKHNFSLEDFKDLKKALDSSNSYWLMNESQADFDALYPIFGRPDYTKEYYNSSINRKQVTDNANKQSKRLEGFWKNY